MVETVKPSEMGHSGLGNHEGFTNKNKLLLRVFDPKKGIFYEKCPPPFLKKSIYKVLIFNWFRVGFWHQKKTASWV
jgi:hypothetical protein